MQMQKSDGTSFYPQTHVQAVEGLDDFTAPVKSVNGKTGTVNLTAADVGAAVPGDIPDVPVTSVNGQTGEVEISALDVGAYDESQVDTLLDVKVDKVTGKGLSANDYTDAEKEKVKQIDDKQDKIIVSPNGSKFIISVADDGTLSTELYEEGSEE